MSGCNSFFTEFLNLKTYQPIDRCNCSLHAHSAYELPCQPASTQPFSRAFLAQSKKKCACTCYEQWVAPYIANRFHAAINKRQRSAQGFHVLSKFNSLARSKCLQIFATTSQLIELKFH